MPPNPPNPKKCNYTSPSTQPALTSADSSYTSAGRISPFCVTQSLLLCLVWAVLSLCLAYPHILWFWLPDRRHLCLKGKLWFKRWYCVGSQSTCRKRLLSDGGSGQKVYYNRSVVCGLLLIHQPASVKKVLEKAEVKLTVNKMKSVHCSDRLCVSFCIYSFAF